MINTNKYEQKSYQKEIDQTFKNLTKAFDRLVITEMRCSGIKYESNGLSDLHSCIKVIEEIKKDTKKDLKQVHKSLRLDYFMFDCIVIEYVYLLQTLESFFRSNRKKPFKVKSYSYQSISVVSYWLVNVINTLSAMKELIMSGYKFQFQVLFRTYIEQIDIIYAILLSEDFFTIYKSYSDTEDEVVKKRIWYKYLRPAKIQELLKHELNGKPELIRIEETYTLLRTAYYESMASTSHSSFVSNMNGAFFLEQKETDILQSTLFGKGNLNSGFALKNFTLFANISLYMIPIFLVDKHKLSLNQFDRSDRDFLLYLITLNNRFKDVMLDDLKKETETKSNAK